MTLAAWEDLGQITQPLRASVSSSGKRDDEDLLLGKGIRHCSNCQVHRRCSKRFRFLPPSRFETIWVSPAIHPLKRETALFGRARESRQPACRLGGQCQEPISSRGAAGLLFQFPRPAPGCLACHKHIFSRENMPTTHSKHCLSTQRMFSENREMLGAWVLLPVLLLVQFLWPWQTTTTPLCGFISPTCKMRGLNSI